MIAVDTNLLVYAHRADSEFHAAASACLRTLAEGRTRWALLWHSLHEFFGVVTHARIYDPPTPAAAALEQIDAWLESPSVVLLSEAAEHWADLRRVLTESKVAGARVHDARVAAVCLSHGIRELWTADRDFSRFPALRTKNPLGALRAPS